MVRLSRWMAGVVLLASVTAQTAGQVNPNQEAKPADERPSEVIVLCTLHQLHEQVAGYSYADLSAAIERLHPDVLAVELTPADLAGHVAQKNKREYQNAVYPLLKKHRWKAVAMEPEGARRTELIDDIRQAGESLRHDSPQKAEAFDTFTDSLFAYLRSKWHSPQDVNAPWTDDLFSVKHAYQGKLFGPKEVEGWEGWNQYFLQRVLGAVKANPGERVVVIVGAEHGYWLRAHLRHQAGVKLIETDRLLQRAAAGSDRTTGGNPAVSRNPDHRPSGGQDQIE